MTTQAVRCSHDRMTAISDYRENSKIRRRAAIGGVVQGVGFRPFVYSAAKRFGVAGFVGNDGRGVFVEAEGDPASVAEFFSHLRNLPPPLAHISSFEVGDIAATGDADFRIVMSSRDDADFTLVSPDIAVCEDCLREFNDPNDRRFHYPFINCTNCGPRFTITERVPYDRPNTTMREFAMCAECLVEYEDPENRRFHAQPNACPKCGPKIRFVANGEAIAESDAAIAEFGKRIKLGDIVGVKGIGGFHLVCDARNDAALERLRERKGRVDKPFAVMCRDSETASEIAHINDAEADLLTSAARPIVLLRSRESALSSLVAPNNRFVGVMLPYAPLHYLLFDERADALVMTSGNHSNEPIVRDNDEAIAKLSSLADSFIVHDREIFVQCDDSVMRTVEIAPSKSVLVPVRRARGYAPFPVALPFEIPPVFAVGGELKAAFCIARDGFGFMSQHIGDMENLETLEAFEKSYAQMCDLFHFAPEVVAGDLHPGYFSSKWAAAKFAETAIPFVRVQHHEAHIASVMAENGLRDENVIGFAFDGTGYGRDGKIWGGEVFVGGYAGFERVAHLEYVPLAGGDASVRQVYRQALSVLRHAGIEWNGDLPPVAECSSTEARILLTQLERGLNVVETSSMGRLFDAVAGIAGVRQRATYEAQAAIEFESLIDESVGDAYEFSFRDGENGVNIIELGEVVERIVADVRKRCPISAISARFHNGIAGMIGAVAEMQRVLTGLNRVALSGGCFQNLSLLTRAVRELEKRDFEVLIHRAVPPNDGGLALGQAVLAAVRVSSKQ